MVTPPELSCFSHSGFCVVRSGEMRSQESPRLTDRKTNCPPRYNAPLGPIWMGAFQLKRKSGSPGPARGRRSFAGAVMLRAAIDVVGRGNVKGDVIELQTRQHR